MTKNYCTFIPSKGSELFRKLKKQYGYNTAKGIFLKAINPQFISDYKNTLSLDAEGVPTYESLITNSFIREFIGEKIMLEGLNKEYHSIEDTRDNYNNLLESAYQFNTTNAQRDNYIATVEHVEEGKIQVIIHPKTEEAFTKFKEQYATNKLNEKLASIFQPLGITIGTLTSAEVAAGRVGVTDFSIARDIANGFVSMIKVANNMEGATALSEEFAHLIVGVFKDNPLIQRAINSLVNKEDALKNILGDKYEDTVNFYNGDMSLVAEEVVGHILQKNLLNDVHNVPTPSLFRRMINWIINQFKPFVVDDVQDVLNKVDSLTSSIARDILNGTTQITKEDITRSQREVQFNALSERIERNIEILRNAAKTETKRYKISKTQANRQKTESLVDTLLSYTDEEADTVEGLFEYAKNALNELRILEFQFGTIDGLVPEQKYSFLRRVKMYIQSYGGFIQSLHEAIIDEETEENNLFLRNFELDGEQIDIRGIVKELNDLSNNLSRRFVKVATPAFAEFLKPFLGEKITVPFGKNAGMEISVDDLIKEAQQDINFMDRWLDSMANSSDTLLQALDAAVKKQKDIARLEAIEGINSIREFRERVEKLGITSFNWMFEKDNDGNKTGNYISEVNYGQFEKDLKAFEEYLEKKYGKNPSGEKAKAKLTERNTWLSNNSISIFGNYFPNPEVYKNKEYSKLTDKQKEVLTEFLSIKAIYDAKYPKHRVAKHKAIQMRKSGSQRLWESATSISTLFENVKEAVASSLLEREDDDTIFGETRTEKGLTDFTGKEFNTLPVLYTTKLKNPNELTDDVIGSLMAYAYSACQYEQMDKIVDPIEIASTLIVEERKVRKTRGNNPLVEKFNSLNIEVVNKVFNSRSNIEAKLEDFKESQVYFKYLKEGGTFELFNKKINTNKLTSLLLKGSSLAQLGFNWLANIANVATGLCMQNIEATAGQFFNRKELLNADAAYANGLLPMMHELTNRTKTNKLGLFFEVFDIKQDFASTIKRVQKKNLLQRLFGSNIAFIGQEAGDHWLYGRTAIALAMREQVLLNGKKMSLWDALKVEDFKKGSNIKQLNIKSITNLDGTPFNVGKFSRKIAEINHWCFGVYNEEDANAANRVAMGRLLQQYRKWMKIQFNRRFQGVQSNLATETWEEGYYRTLGRLMNELVRGKFRWNAEFNKLSQDEKYNIKRALTEIFQFMAVWAIANWVEWPDDKDRPWAMKLAEYSSKRLAHELGGLTPSLTMPEELLKTVRNPIPATSAINNGLNLIKSVVDPSDWSDEIQSGPYKGMSTLDKHLLKAPLPGIAQYRQLDKFISNIDSSIGYYARPSY